MKQDKEGGVVVMDKINYFDQCLDMLNTKQSEQLDPTSSSERKAQCTLRKTKQELPANVSAANVYAKL